MAVGGGTDGEVEPVGAAGTALDEEFVEVGPEGALGNLRGDGTRSAFGSLRSDGSL